MQLREPYPTIFTVLPMICRSFPAVYYYDRRVEYLVHEANPDTRCGLVEHFKFNDGMTAMANLTELQCIQSFADFYSTRYSGYLPNVVKRPLVLQVSALLVQVRTSAKRTARVFARD